MLQGTTGEATTYFSALDNGARIVANAFCLLHHKAEDEDGAFLHALGHEELWKAGIEGGIDVRGGRQGVAGCSPKLLLLPTTHVPRPNQGQESSTQNAGLEPCGTQWQPPWP